VSVLSCNTRDRLFRGALALACLVTVALAFVPELPVATAFGVGTAWAEKDTLVISRGRLHRNARDGATAETLIVNRKNDGDVDISIGDRRRIKIDGDSNNGGDVVLMGDDVFVDKDEVIDGDVVAVGGSVTVLGKVIGNAVAVGGTVTLGDSAVVGGDAVSVGGSVERSSGARVGGEVVNVGVSLPLPFLKAPRNRPQHAIFNFFRWIVFYLVIFAAAALCIYLARDRLGYASTYLGREPFPSFLLGALSPVLALVAFVLLCITLIGIPVAAALIFLYPVFLFMGWVVSGHRIGSSVKGESTVTVRTVFTGLLVVSGLHMLSVLVRLIGIGGVPVFLLQMAGVTLSFTAALVGLGAILGTRFRRPPGVVPAAGYPPVVPPPGYPIPPGTPMPPAAVMPPASPYAPPPDTASGSG
jgi:hypothetical protein